MNEWQPIDLQKKAISGLMRELAEENIGIYPAAVSGGPNAYEKRSDWQEGWNACSMALTENHSKIAAWFSAIPADVKTQVEDLLLRDRLTLFVRDDSISLAVNCSDEFWWGCADAEDISFEEIPALLACFGEVQSGGELWVARKRNMRPQTASYEECYPPKDWPIFDAAGPVREDADGKRRPDLARARKVDPPVDHPKDEQ